METEVFQPLNLFVNLEGATLNFDYSENNIFYKNDYGTHFSPFCSTVLQNGHRAYYSTNITLTTYYNNLS